MKRKIIILSTIFATIFLTSCSSVKILNAVLEEVKEAENAQKEEGGNVNGGDTSVEADEGRFTFFVPANYVAMDSDFIFRV